MSGAETRPGRDPLRAGSSASGRSRCRVLVQKVTDSAENPLGKWFSRGHLHRILTNRIYIGEIVHRDASYPGGHAAIVDGDLWARVRSRLADNRTAVHHGERTSSPALLKGLIFDDAGNRMTPSHTVRDGRRNSYYVSQAVVQNRPEEEGSVRRLPAPDVDRVVANAVRKALEIHATPTRRSLDHAGPANDTSSIRNLIRKVVVARRSITLTMAEPADPTEDHSEKQSGGSVEPSRTLVVPFEFVEKGGVTRIVANGDPSALFAKPDSSLVKAVARAHVWKKQLLSGEARSVTELARRAGVTRPYVTRILRLSFLAPDLVDAILDGRQSSALTVERLRDPIPLDWAEQRKLLTTPQSR